VKLLLGLAVFLITMGETFVAGREKQAIEDRQAVRAATWSTIFEALLLIDIWLVVHEVWVAVPILIGAWLGTWIAVKRRPPPT
jgi:uncharacterized membrane protein YfcA